MADPFQEALAVLLERCPEVSGAAFTDLDGADIALQPKSSAEALRACAAFGGLALRRLDTAERAAGRGGVARLSLQGDAGQFRTYAVGDGYQLLVAVEQVAWSERVDRAARAAVKRLESAI